MHLLTPGAHEMDGPDSLLRVVVVQSTIGNRVVGIEGDGGPGGEGSANRTVEVESNKT